MRLKDVVRGIYIDPRKLTDYALNPESLKGRHKAAMFHQHLGFTRKNYQLLLEQIQAQAMEADAILGFLDEYGQRYQVDLVINWSRSRTARSRSNRMDYWTQ